jgi:hypothetical protein
MAQPEIGNPNGREMVLSNAIKAGKTSQLYASSTAL